MTILEAIVAHLLADAGVSAIAATRVYAKSLPQSPTYPALVIHNVSGTSEHSQDGPSGLAEPRFQIDCFSPRKASSVLLVLAVQTALDGFQGTMGGGGGVSVDAVFVENRRDDYDDELEVHVDSRDFLIMHHE